MYCKVSMNATLLRPDPPVSIVMEPCRCRGCCLTAAAAEAEVAEEESNVPLPPSRPRRAPLPAGCSSVRELTSVGFPLCTAVGLPFASAWESAAAFGGASAYVTLTAGVEVPIPSMSPAAAEGTASASAWGELAASGGSGGNRPSPSVKLLSSGGGSAAVGEVSGGEGDLRKSVRTGVRFTRCVPFAVEVAAPRPEKATSGGSSSLSPAAFRISETTWNMSSSDRSSPMQRRKSTLPLSGTRRSKTFWMAVPLLMPRSFASTYPLPEMMLTGWPTRS
mmetsp:Transcript_24666/g.48383  ORF Transcript_24666/g.48383 Transcript_24666/m.48383 type:complete len:277 (-) Transcript_24666:2926-3756(-)